MFSQVTSPRKHVIKKIIIMFATDPKMHLFHPIPLPPFPRWWLGIEEPFSALGVEFMLAVVFLVLVKDSAHLFIFFLFIMLVCVTSSRRGSWQKFLKQHSGVILLWDTQIYSLWNVWFAFSSRCGLWVILHHYESLRENSYRI